MALFSEKEQDRESAESLVRRTIKGILKESEGALFEIAFECLGASGGVSREVGARMCSTGVLHPGYEEENDKYYLSYKFECVM